MAKKQTRRSISVSRNMYERLKAYCETNSISMSQFVEQRVGEVLGRGPKPSQIEVRPMPVRDTEVKVSADQIFTF